MRKLAGLILLMMVVAVPAFAQSADIGSAFAVTLPDDLASVSPSEEDREEGLFWQMDSESISAVAYRYESDPTYVVTLDELYATYVAEQEEGFYSEVAIEEIGGLRVIVYEIDDMTFGAVTVSESGDSYELILMCETEEAVSSAQAIIQSITAIA